MAYRSDYQEAAEAYYQVRWLHEGRDKRGIDCAGVVIAAGWDTGLLDRSVDVQGYVRQSDTFDFASYFDKYMQRKRWVDRRPGDVLLFRQNLNPCHCGIMIDRPGRGESFIHAHAPRRCVTYDPLDASWVSKAFTFCYQFEFED